MKQLKAVVGYWFLILCGVVLAGRVMAQGTAFTYQGQLNGSGGPATGRYDFTFMLYTTNVTGTPVAGPVTYAATGVTNGLFTTLVDFGPGVFTGSSNWLEIAVRTNGAGSYVTLAPRQQVTPTPYAIYATSAGNATSATTAQSANAVAATNITGTIPAAVLPASIVTNGGNGTLAELVAGGTNFTAQANTAYDLTNAAEVSVALPTNAKVGDVVQVSGTGTGGWQVTEDNFFAWLELTNAPTMANWYGIASSADGTHLVAVVNGGGIYTSTNSGMTWTEPTNSPTHLFWRAVASSSDGGHLAAVVTDGGIYTSADSGVTWTEQTGAPTMSDWQAIASSSDGTHLAAVAYAGGIFISTNSGVTWTEEMSAPVPANWIGVASSANGMNLVAMVYEGGVYTSANGGVTWTEQAGAPSAVEWQSVASSADGTHLAAAALEGGIYTSANGGVTWTEQTNAPTAGYWWSVASSADGVHLAAVGIGGEIYTSADGGVTWLEQATAPTPAAWASVATSADGTHLTAVTLNGGIYSAVDDLTGAAGTAESFQYLGNGRWLPLPPTAGYVVNQGSLVLSPGNGGGLTNVPGTLVQAVAAGTNFVAEANTAYDLTNSALVSVTLPASANVGDVIQVAGSGTGGWQVAEAAIVSWPVQTNAPTPSTWTGVAASADGTHLVAVAPGLGIYTSANSGLTWIKQTNAPTLAYWRAVASSADGTHLVAVVEDGGIYTSINSGVTWTEPASAPAGDPWSGVAASADGTHLVAVAPGLGIYTSANSGVTWLHQTNAPIQALWLGVATSADGTHLVAVANYGGIYTSADSGVTWTEQPGAPTSTNWQNVASSADGTHLVAVVHQGGIYTSADSGVTWTEQPGAPNPAAWYGIASSADGTHLAAVVFDGAIYTSADSGVTWREQTSAPTSALWYSVASSADGGHLVAVAYEGGICTSQAGLAGAAGTMESFQYLGNGLWQPLPPSAGYLVNNGAIVLAPGDGSGLTSLSAAALTGSVPVATLTAVPAGNLTGSVPAAALTSVPAASLTGTLPAAAFPVNLGLAGALNLDINGTYGSNPGTVRSNALTFGTGPAGSGEGIASKRAGTNPFDLEFYTGFINRMTILASGNVGIGTTNPAYLFQVGSATQPAYCNGTTWVNSSDRNAKEDFATIDPRAVLAKVSALPITEWRYKVEADGTEHLGPMAQDFHAAFGLNGADDKHISTVDEGGVALAAIQGLNQEVREKEADKDARIQEQEARIQKQATEIGSLQEKVAALQAVVEQLAQKR